MFEIVKTKPGDGNFKLFEDFPKEIYPGDSLFFKMPQTIYHEYLEAGYMLLVNGKVQCRAALYNNPYLQYRQQKACAIGSYESSPGLGAAGHLIKHMANEARKINARYLIGPMNGSTWDAYRFSVHHDHPNFFLEPYHHLYYQTHFLKSGFNIIAKYYSSIDTKIKFNSPSILQKENEFIQAGVKFRNINLNDYETELEKVFDFNNIAFRSNYLYTPISKEDFMKKYAQTKKFIDSQFVILAEDIAQNLLGYFFCFRDVNNQASKTLIAKTVARNPEKKWGGMGHVLGNIICRRAVDEGYQSIIHAFIYDRGSSTGMSNNFAGSPYKNYVLFGMQL